MHLFVEVCILWPFMAITFLLSFSEDCDNSIARREIDAEIQLFDEETREYKWNVSNDNTQECVGKCVISNVTSDSFDVQVSHARSQGIGYYPKTAYLQKDGTYVADGDISGRNVKTNESEYTPVKFVFTVLDNDRIKMDVYETKTNKEIETNVIFYL